MLVAVALLGLSVPTAELESAVPGCLAIDHIAVPGAVRTRSAPAGPVSRKRSDHWAYVVDADLRANLDAKSRMHPQQPVRLQLHLRRTRPTEPAWSSIWRLP